MCTLYKLVINSQGDTILQQLCHVSCCSCCLPCIITYRCCFSASSPTSLILHLHNLLLVNHSLFSEITNRICHQRRCPVDIFLCSVDVLLSVHRRNALGQLVCMSSVSDSTNAQLLSRKARLLSRPS
ncbi:hypothetical protein NP493_797g01052 [Ridgeia piscesae]|uniref:Uncharacterized protein n=1 Tax=Ridgeia piscesae TaxID=27915 RepID=A0AAD9KNE8_RIDPI|nr:hypothetical protein NP493_797g01052 [Ridgeia piscesae]